eukprot:5159821-Pleurochrysis_carterae.AAC.3
MLLLSFALYIERERGVRGPLRECHRVRQRALVHASLHCTATQEAPWALNPACTICSCLCLVDDLHSLRCHRQSPWQSWTSASLTK